MMLSSRTFFILLSLAVVIRSVPVDLTDQSDSSTPSRNETTILSSTDTWEKLTAGTLKKWESSVTSAIDVATNETSKLYTDISAGIKDGASKVAQFSSTLVNYTSISPSGSNRDMSADGKENIRLEPAFNSSDTICIGDEMLCETERTLAQLIARILEVIAIAIGVAILTVLLLPIPYYLLCLMFRCILCVIGFTPRGVSSGSYAAHYQSGIGNVEEGSVFSRSQSYGARGDPGTSCLSLRLVIGIISGSLTAWYVWPYL